MALPIKLKRSAVAGKVPTTTQIDLGEIAINTFDGILYLKKDNGTESVVTIKEVTENNLSVNTSAFTNSTANNLADVLADLDFSISENNESIKIYTYTLASNSSVITGADDNSKSLEYSIGLESVYINGVLQTSGVDYITTNINTITLDEQALSGTTITIIARMPTLNILNGISTTITSNTSAQVVDSFSKATYRTAKYFIQITDNTNSEYHATELLLVHDGSNVFSTEYGTVFSNSSLGTVTADISVDTVRVLVAPTTANSTIKTQRITIGV
jgi:hypothetical protein